MVDIDTGKRWGRRARNQDRRRLTRSWKAMVLEALVQLAPDYGRACGTAALVAHVAEHHPQFARKAAEKVPAMMEELLKEETALRFFPGSVVHLDEDEARPFLRVKQLTTPATHPSVPGPSTRAPAAAPRARHRSRRRVRRWSLWRRLRSKGLRRAPCSPPRTARRAPA